MGSKKLPKKPRPIADRTRTTPEGQLSGHLEKDCEELRKTMRDAGDLQCTLVYTRGHRRAALFYYENTVDTSLISEGIMRPLQQYEHQLDPEILAQAVISTPGTSKDKNLTSIAAALAVGKVALLLDGYCDCLLVNAAGVKERPIGRSESEDVLIGPHDSFSESLGTNLALIRKRLPSPLLKYKIVKVGRVSATPVAIIFVETIVNEKLVDEVEERLRRIDVDHLYGKSVTDYICDEPSAMLPLLRATERPGRVIAALMEGRVAIIAEGDPGTVIAPSFAPEYIQASEDYYERPQVATFLRFIRFMGLIISVFLPGVWISLTAFHHGIIPPPLFNSIQASREGVPLPTVLEMVILLVAFDIIVEASTRMPMRIGQALGIVGGIILGQAAVQAGLVSPAMVIIVALSGLAIFTQPSPGTIGPIRLMKYPVLIVSSILGLFGTTWAVIFIVQQVTSMRSFGYPYMYPISPFDWRGETDIFLRAPLFWLGRRPKLLSSNTKRAQVTPPYPGKGEKR